MGPFGRHAEEHLLAAAPGTQPLLDDVPLVQILLEQDAGRHEGRFVVILLDEGRHHLAVLLGADPFQHERLPADQLAAADEEDLHARLASARILGKGDDVLVFLLAAHHLLPLDELARGPDLVAQHRRALELQPLSRLLHARRHLSQRFFAVAFQEIGQPGDDLAIAVPVHRADARPGAALDVVIQAWLGVLTGDLARAVEIGEDAAQPVEGLAHGIGRGERAVVAPAVALHAPDDADLREILLPVELDVGIGFVVAQADVEAGPVALDQLVFEDQRLQLGVGDDPLQVGDLGHQAAGLGIAIGLEVRPDAILQHHRLADVNHLAVGRAVEVDPRPLRQGVELLGQIRRGVGVHRAILARMFGEVNDKIPVHGIHRQG